MTFPLHMDVTVLGDSDKFLAEAAKSTETHLDEIQEPSSIPNAKTWSQLHKFR